MLRRTALALVFAATLLAACQTAKRTAWQMGIPGVSPIFDVDEVRHRFGHLDARLSSGNVTRRIFAREDDPACAAMLVEGQEVDWGRTEMFGPLRQGDLTCSVVGLGDLETWRNARGRASTTTNPVTRSRTRYRIIHRDEEFLYALGGFSVARLLGWTPGTDQVIALLPRNEVCAEADSDGLWSVRFRIAGTPAIGIVTPKGLCRVDAVLAAPRS